MSKKDLVSITDIMKDKDMANFLKAKLDRLNSFEDDAKDAAKKIHENIALTVSTPNIQEHLSFSPMPTDLCRTSPFFPMSKSEMKDRPYLKDMLITPDNSWGSITYTGPKLSIREEDFLIGILALLDSRKYRKEVEIDGVLSYKYQGPIAPILGIMGLATSGHYYKAAIESATFLHGAVFKLNTFKKDKQTKSRNVSSVNITNALSMAHYDAEKKELTVVVNPYFYEMYHQGRVTFINIDERMKLGGPIAKSLHEFLSSQRPDEWVGNFRTIARALNMSDGSPDKETRRNLKRAINELIKIDYLEPRSGFTRDDNETIYFFRNKRAKRKAINR